MPLLSASMTASDLPSRSALAVACRDIDVRNVKALIIGPHETPYEFGFFEVTTSPGLVTCLVADGLVVLVQIQQGSVMHTRIDECQHVAHHV